MRRGDRWRGQAMSEEVKQKQAEDCFLRLRLHRCLETPLVSALHQGTTFSAPGEDTVHLQSSVCANVKKKKKKRMSADFFMMMCNRLTYCCTEL